MLLVAPSEHEIQSILRLSDRESSGPQPKWSISSLPEKHGCDFLSILPSGIIGYQRKTLPDLVASLADGRLNYELSQIESSSTLTQAFLIIESTLTRTLDGNFIDAQLSAGSLRSTLAKWASAGVGYLPSANQRDTISCILGVSRYLESGSHHHRHRPKDIKDEWGRVGSDAYSLFLLQSFPGIGPKQAAAIHAHFGRVPIAWTVTESDLMAVPGIGKKTAQSLIKALRLD